MCYDVIIDRTKAQRRVARFLMVDRRPSEMVVYLPWQGTAPDLRFSPARSIF
jgi:hypothetical protein